MIINKVPLHTLADTLREIERLSLYYAEDMNDYRTYNLYEIFDFISKVIKYEKDPKGIELVCRPKWTLKRNAGDCDDKTVCFLAYAYLNEIPSGYSVVSEKDNKPYHHIFPYIIVNGKIIDWDATYNYNRPGKLKVWKKRINKTLIKEK